jgi:hypothetical protein
VFGNALASVVAVLPHRRPKSKKEVDDGDETNADWLKAVDLNRVDADDGVFDNIDF